MIYGRLQSPIDPRAKDFYPFEATKTSSGLPNVPDPAAEEQIRLFAIEVLQPLRDVLGPITVNSWFRAPAVNAATSGSSETSEHMEGSAADVDNDWFSNREMAAYLWTRADLPLGEVIWYKDKGHLHVSRDPRNRREFRVHEGSGAGQTPPWRPSQAEVDAVLRKIAGAPGATGHWSPPRHPARDHVEAAQGGGGGILLVGLAVAAGMAASRRRYGPVEKKKGKRRRR